MQRVGRLGACLIVFVGLVVLFRWYGGALTTLAPGLSSMKPNTALSLVVLGIAVAAPDRRYVAVPLGAAVACLGLATLAEYASGASFGIDVLLPGIDVGDVVPRMAPATAASMLALGTAVVAGALARHRVMRGLAMVAFGVGEVAVLGYAYGVSSLYSVGGYTSMALHSAVSIVVLSMSLLLSDPSSGLVGLIRRGGSASRLLRPLIPFLLLGPPALGWFCLWAEDQGWFDGRIGVAVLIMSMTVLGGALSWRAAIRLDQLDRERGEAWAAMDETNRTLEATVTERTRELADRQSFTDELLETVDVGVVSCDAAGENFVRNRAHRELVGLQDGSVTMALLDEDGAEVAYDRYPMIRALRGEEPGVVDMLIGPPGGPYREIVTRNSQILDVDGAVLGAVAVLTDVTAERVASRALSVQHQQLVEAQRIGQLGSFEYDFASGVWTFSDQLCALWGVGTGDLEARVTSELIVEEDRQLAADSWQSAAREGGQHSCVYRIHRGNDGVERIIRSTVEVELGADGVAIRGHGTHQDITDLTLAERAAQQANAFFEAVLTATPDYTFVTDLESGGVLYGSPGKDILGLTSEALANLGPAGPLSLVHPDDLVRLRAINDAAKELEDGQVLKLRYRGLHADGEWRWLSRRVTPFRRDASGVVLEVLGVVRDITDVINAEEVLSHAALHDGLTGLPNRALLVDRLEAALARSARENREVAVLFCDLDGFKEVNDTGGHAAGDAVLVEIAQRMTGVLRDEDTVARVGGDEFVIVIEPWDRQLLDGNRELAEPDLDLDRALAERIARRVADVVRQPVTFNSVQHRVSASIGITYALLARDSRGNPVTAEEILQDADTAMYLAKGRGKDRVEVFEHGPGDALAARA